MDLELAICAEVYAPGATVSEARRSAGGIHLSTAHVVIDFDLPLIGQI
jgi:hypothetical protein